MPTTDTRKLYHRWLHELWPSGNTALAEQLITPDFVGHWPHRDVRGADELVAMIEQSLTLFSEVTITTDVGPIVDGDLIAARWSFRGRYAGGLPNVPAPAGIPAVLRGADVLRIADGRCAEYWVSSDTEQLLTNLGAH